MGGIVIAKFLVKFFRVNWITKMYQKRNFSLPLVGLIKLASEKGLMNLFLIECVILS